MIENSKQKMLIWVILSICIVFYVAIFNWHSNQDVDNINIVDRTKTTSSDMNNYISTRRQLIESTPLTFSGISNTIRFNNTVPTSPTNPTVNKAIPLDFQNPISLIKCGNQTKCIPPSLQLKKQFKVYYCKHVGHGVRFYYLIREGLLLHPQIVMVNNPDEADIVVYLPVSADWGRSECSNKKFHTKTLVLDEGDYPQLFDPDGAKFLLMFKRSYVRRRSGIFNGYMNYIDKLEVLPMTYTMMEAYIRNTFTLMANRDLEILCTLRGSQSDPVRLRVRQWVSEYAVARGVKKYSAGEVNSASRTVVSKNYFEQMYRSQIIVTSNPSGWEGDFRLCEALASGALIFVDHMYVPRPNPFVANKHIILYDNNNKTDLFEKLDFYRTNRAIARRVALSGYLHAMTFHRAANLIDYVFRTLHVKLVTDALIDINSNNLFDFNVTEVIQRQNVATKNIRFKPESIEYIKVSKEKLKYSEIGYEMRERALAASREYILATGVKLKD